MTLTEWELFEPAQGIGYHKTKFRRTTFDYSGGVFSPGQTAYSFTKRKTMVLSGKGFRMVVSVGMNTQMVNIGSLVLQVNTDEASMAEVDEWLIERECATVSAVKKESRL